MSGKWILAPERSTDDSELSVKRKTAHCGECSSAEGSAVRERHTHRQTDERTEKNIDREK